ncbi:MAG: hypothetical protein AAGB11_16440 [Pseudomonadota bacterium]
MAEGIGGRWLADGDGWSWLPADRLGFRGRALRFIVALAVVSAFFLPPSGVAADTLAAQEIKKLILGKRLVGVLEDTNQRWFECIAPSGDTVFNIEGRISAGFVEVHDGGVTCFTYPRRDDTSRACFTAVSEKGTLVFVELVFGTRFRVDAIDERFDEYPPSRPTS